MMLEFERGITRPLSGGELVLEVAVDLSYERIRSERDLFSSAEAVDFS
jgi:hypothetical protein